MATNYPGALDTSTTLPQPSGTSTLVSPDHAGAHTNISLAAIAIEQKLGVQAGSPTLNTFLSGSGNGTSVWTAAGTMNNFTLGSPAITGGTITGGVHNAGTFGTPSLTGGTLTTPTINTGTLGTPTINQLRVKGVFDNGNSGTAITINIANGDRQKLTVTGGTCTIAWSNFASGDFLKLYVNQDVTGGRVITLPSGKWPNASSGVFGTVGSVKNTLIVDYDGTDYMYQLAPSFG